MRSKNNSMIVLVLFCGMFCETFAQTTIPASSASNQDVFVSQSQWLNAATQQNDTNRNLVNTQDVVIQQIGSNNSLDSFVLSENYDLNYVQIGNDNSVKSYHFTSEANERILQRGSNNEIFNLSFGNVEGSSLNVIQRGTNLTLTKYGTNSQTNNMAVRLTGNDRSVLIRSY